jgi:hypothetical protein
MTTLLSRSSEHFPSGYADLVARGHRSLPAGLPKRLMRERDYIAARCIPDVYLLLQGTPRDRVMELLRRNWAWRPEPDRWAFAQVLLAILGSLNARSPEVPHALRNQCETTVLNWIVSGRQLAPANGGASSHGRPGDHR